MSDATGEDSGHDEPPETSRVVLVTGAARGIGSAVVDALCAQGQRVVAVDWVAGVAPDAGVPYPQATPDELAEVAARWPGQVVPRVADVRDASALRRVVDEATAELGGLDAAVAGAAVVAGGLPAWEESDDVWRLLWEVDVLGVVHTARAVLPHLLRSPAGRFVAVASAAAHDGLFGLSAYCAAKHAVAGFTRSLAADLVGTTATACAVSPGSTDTAMLAATAALYGVDDVEDLAAGMLVRRVLRPEEVAAVVAHCCSPAGAVHAGSVVRADGGFS